MKADFQSYAQAVSRCVLGLVVQLAMGLALLIYSIYAQDPAARTASGFVLVGVPVWLLLLIVFDQHRRERIEALEAETLSEADQTASSVFDEAGDDLRVAARRLRMMHTYILPAASLVIGAVLIAIGVWRLMTGLEYVDPDGFTPPEHHGWALTIGLSVGFLGFVFARYISGMAKRDAWANLRAGAGYAVGASLIGLTMALGHFVDIAGSSIVLRYLHVVYPIAMIVIGVEVYLNFVLNLYRPRRADEVARPAFDSRILSFVAAPDRIAESVGEAINYQFGFNVSSSWFYKLLSRDLPGLIAIGLLVGWALTTVAVVEPHQRALRVRMGRLVAANLEPGIYFKLPWPFESIVVPEHIVENNEGEIADYDHTVTSLRTINLGTLPQAEGETPESSPLLWTTEVAANESYMIVQPATSEFGPTNGVALLAVEIPMHYAVRDVKAFELLGPPEQRRYYLGVVARREATWYLSTLTVDELLSSKRIEVARELQRRIEEAFTEINPLGEEHGPVVQVLSVGIQGVRPPRDVAHDFHRVVEAKEMARSRLAFARGEAITTRTEMVGSVDLADEIVAGLEDINRLEEVDAAPEEITEHELEVEAMIERAGGQAATILAEARADRWQRHMEARSRLAEYRGLVDTYLAAPAVFMARRYFDALSDALADARIYITDPPPGGLTLRVDLHDEDTAVNVFEQPADEDTEGH